MTASITPSSAPATYPLRLDLPAGSLSVSLAPETVRDLQGAIAQISQALKAVAQTATANRSDQRSDQGSAQRSAQRPTQRPTQRPIEYQYTGSVFLELFCNPNIWPTPFAAKVLLSVRDDRLRLSSEVELVRFSECLERYFDQIPT